MTSHFQDEFQRRLNRTVDEAIDFHVVAFTEGLKALLIGKTIVDAKGEVWSSEGHWAIVLTLDDGSIIEVPAETRAAGPLAELVRVAGGNPFGSENSEKEAKEHGWTVG
jgi:hypothetical protein